MATRRPHRRPRAPRVVKGTPSVELSHAEFTRRFRERVADPRFRAVDAQIDEIADVASGSYIEYRKSPRTRRAGPGFAHPDYELSLDWLETRDRIRAAERAHKNRRAPSRVLLINGSARSDQTCPGEMSKSYRLAQIARRVIARCTATPRVPSSCARCYATGSPISS